MLDSSLYLFYLPDYKNSNKTARFIQRGQPLPEYLDNFEIRYTAPVIQPNNREQPASSSFFRDLRKYLSWNTLFLFVLIFGAAIAVILTIVLSADSSPREDIRTMYFSMYIGDTDEEVQRFERFLQTSNDNTHCSLETNKNNTEKSILEITKRGVNQRYSFILYGDDANVTEPMKARDAANELKSIRAEQQTAVKQTKALEQFRKKSQGRAKDILVHYIPCRFNYSSEDAETKQFIDMIRKAGSGKRPLLVSNTENKTVLAKIFNISENDVVGQNDSIAEKIADIAVLVYKCRMLPNAPKQYPAKPHGGRTSSMRGPEMRQFFGPAPKEITLSM
ncbi:unnamed protein product [Cylicocyclus nassatus]|uniref:Uncharacterized protein n=1 Tax=Cylicocyclus nassatus TaxID=53992 RepID=A0AA36GLQ3_CYLNA|nr:unnamed protein product [Cylicocyclus nassatus]